MQDGNKTGLCVSILINNILSCSNLCKSPHFFFLESLAIKLLIPVGGNQMKIIPILWVGGGGEVEKMSYAGGGVC